MSSAERDGEWLFRLRPRMDDLMDLSKVSLSDIGSVASIISLPLSVYTIYLVSRVRQALKDRAMDKRVNELFGSLQMIPPGKKKLTSSQRDEVNWLVKCLEDFYLSPFPWRDRNARKLTKQLKQEVQSDAAVMMIKRTPTVLRDQLFITSRP